MSNQRSAISDIQEVQNTLAHQLSSDFHMHVVIAFTHAYTHAVALLVECLSGMYTSSSLAPYPTA